ncbi:hypothetical protein DFH08DRAFT_812026 [Mycena albidolilacea]|uniref:Uncharacterized protein n=1 Tax=Mycena albidolilacea TaxID=1033008 RepID=A0AAD7EMU6_9AGAR|nr:hypothetical protein DFH08DRAFT_812026 [Mycena albidolilacea]
MTVDFELAETLVEIQPEIAEVEAKLPTYVQPPKGNSGFEIRKEFPTPSAGPSPPLRAAAWDTTGGGLDRQFDYLTEADLQDGSGIVQTLPDTSGIVQMLKEHKPREVSPPDPPSSPNFLGLHVRTNDLLSKFNSFLSPNKPVTALPPPDSKSKVSVTEASSNIRPSLNTLKHNCSLAQMTILWRMCSVTMLAAPTQWVPMMISEKAVEVIIAATNRN